MESLAPNVHFIRNFPTIALYPALAAAPDKLVCAWYAYGSPVRPDRSDIWSSSSPDGVVWLEPVCVSRGVSYNNGPSLVALRGGGFRLAWHSWRPPGKEPFTPDGNVSNIWYADSSDGLNWTEPTLALPDVLDTRYASLACDSEGFIWLVCEHRPSGNLLLVKGDSSGRWQTPEKIQGATHVGKCPDLAFDSRGRMHLVYTQLIQGRSTVLLSSSSDRRTWTTPENVFPGETDSLARPKIGNDSSDRLWVSAHSSVWGSFVHHFDLEVREGIVSIHFKSEPVPGGIFWVANGVEVRGPKSQRFSFGPDQLKLPDDWIAVDATDCLYSKARGYGFDRAPEQLLRELGSPLTRKIMYDERPATFSIDLPPGSYEILIHVSSWIASRPSARVNITGAVVSNHKHPAPSLEKCQVACMDGDGLEIYRLAPGDPFEDSRPSRVVEWGKAHVAWTRCDSTQVGIVIGSVEPRKR
ncbi:MAG: hypothetical protein K8S54_13675 [Spirochaetia bacterium]|nr:hypothetical protein [Spirochaetia bacterium]